MKSHELAAHLEALAKLLRSMPNVELKTALARLHEILSATERSKRPHPREPAPLPEDIEAKLAAMTPAQIEQYLGSDTEAEPFTTGRLIALAERLGISTSKRQNRGALVNLIARYFEANQLDSMIRGTRKDET